jgi:anti-anti-sigma regulatory factor
MATVPVFLEIDMERVRDSLQEALEFVECAEGEAVLDFSGVDRIDAKQVSTLQEIAAMADVAGVKVALCGVNVKIYKVLKLARLAARFGFVCSKAVRSE